MKRILLHSILLFSLLSLQPHALATEEEVSTLRRALIDISNQEYATAVLRLELLLAYGSPEAAYLLGWMILDEQGIEYDPVRALALFQAAAQWNHPEAEGIANQISGQLTTDEVRRANHQAEALHLHRIISNDEVSVPLESHKAPEPIERRTPHYPTRQGRRGIQSYVYTYIVIGPDGRVISSYPVNSPHMDFTRTIRRALRTWRYETSESNHVRPILMSFGLGAEEFRSDIRKEF
ncbi:MAG: energy transducer TonB [Idiomarina sp.]|nr:energy transducer TonB [Idiomarina sp.]